jgi:hypothetical protein
MNEETINYLQFNNLLEYYDEYDNILKNYKIDDKFNPPHKSILRKSKFIHGLIFTEQEMIEKDKYYRKNRNKICDCGSGLKTKNCCGKTFKESIINRLK